MEGEFSVRVLRVLCDLIELQNMTQSDASEHLRQIFPSIRGFSPRSIRRLCTCNEIRRRSSLEDRDLDRLIRANIARVSIVGCDQ